jgi:4-hydroxy-3-methylbut-2-enyl diphosphate reductase
VKPEWLESVETVAVTAGASAPENLVEKLIAHLHAAGFGALEEVEIKEEDVRFQLPAELNRTVQLQTVARV